MKKKTKRRKAFEFRTFNVFFKRHHGREGVRSFKQDKGRVLTTVQRLMPTTESILFMFKSMQINNSSQVRSFVGVGLSPSSSSSVEGSKLHQDFEIN